jgi:guanylate kinase
MVKHLLETYPGQYELSISATTRAPRGQEQHGKEYYFISREEFEQHIQNNDFIEYEQVYEGLYYGTLKSEIDRIWGNGKIVVFDVDVLGGMRLKEYFGSKALSIFVMPPSIEVLEQRLRIRNTETEEAIQKRLSRSSLELQHSTKFDLTIVNDILENAVEEAKMNIQSFLNK